MDETPVPEIKFGVVRAYRYWVLTLGRLLLPRSTSEPMLCSPYRPMTEPAVWPWDVPLKARCYHGHQAPEFECDCGIYGLKNLPLVSDDEELMAAGTAGPTIRGEVDLFGRVVYAPDGYRAEYAKVHSLGALILCVSCAVLEDKHTVVNLDTEGVVVAPPINVVDWVGELNVCAITMCPSCVTRYRLEGQFRGKVNEFTVNSYIDGIEEYMNNIWKLVPLSGIFDEVCNRYCNGRRMLEVSFQRGIQ